jgi:hypothetical protein
VDTDINSSVVVAMKEKLSPAEIEKYARSLVMRGCYFAAESYLFMNGYNIRQITEKLKSWGVKS